ncbi:MAG: hypothetical protein WC654_03745 [Patescibacteria group bacterium]
MAKAKQAEQAEYESESRACGTCGNAEPSESIPKTHVYCPIVDEDMSMPSVCDDWKPKSTPAPDSTPTKSISVNGVDITDPASPSGMDEDQLAGILEPIVRRSVGSTPAKARQIKEFLKYKFSREATEAHASELARSFGELERQKNQKKEVAKAMDADISKTENRISELASWVKDGYEYRNVDCEMIYDYDLKEKRTVRLDTFEVIKVVPMNAEDLQRDLGLGK